MENQEFNNTNQYTQPVTAPMKPKNWLTEAILVTVVPLCCCLYSSLLGIVAIVFASKVNNLYLAGQYAEAQQAAKNAKMWVLITLGAVLAMLIFYIIRFRIVFGSVGNFIDLVREQMELMESGGGIW